MNKTLLIVIALIVLLVVMDGKILNGQKSNEEFSKVENDKQSEYNNNEKVLNKKQKKVRFNLNDIEICNDDYSASNVKTNNNSIDVEQPVESNKENKLLNDYVFNSDFVDNNPMNEIDNRDQPYTEFLKLDKYTEKNINHIQLDRMYDIQNNADRYNTQKIKDVYDNIVDNQVLNTRDPNNQKTFYNEGVNGEKTIKDDVWGYDNENISNGGKMKDGLYAYDPQNNNNMTVI